MSKDKKVMDLTIGECVAICKKNKNCSLGKDNPTCPLHQICCSTFRYLGIAFKNTKIEVGEKNE